jgi:hypothetical protein
MADPRNPRALFGRALFLSAAALLLLALLFAAGVFPVDPDARRLLSGLLVFVAVVDLLIGRWFMKRSS